MDKYCITKSYTIMEAIEKIDENHDRAILVKNDCDKIVGLLTQGDIIRALINGKDLYSEVNGILKHDFYYLTEKNMEVAYEIFSKKKITLLPIVDNNFKLIEVVTLNDVYAYMEAKKFE